MIDARLSGSIEQADLLSSEYLPDNSSGSPLKDRYHLKDHAFYIGDVIIKNPIIAAPLAGISDNTFRIFSNLFASGLNYSEMISSYGLTYGHKKSLRLAKVSQYERPCSIQIFGNEPEIMGKAAKIIEDKADIIDINMGCPVPKILKSGSGGHLLRDIDKASRIIQSVKDSVNIPVSLKTRIGWDEDDKSLLKLAKKAQDLGISCLCVHGRTVIQGYSGKADHGPVKELKSILEIPVIASGDISGPEQAKKILGNTACDGIMIGRAIRAKHYLLKNIYRSLKTNTPVRQEPGTDWIKRYMILYLKALIVFKGQEKAIKEFRKHLNWAFRGKRGVSSLRKSMFEIDSLQGALELINNIN